MVVTRKGIYRRINNNVVILQLDDFHLGALVVLLHIVQLSTGLQT